MKRSELDTPTLIRLDNPAPGEVRSLTDLYERIARRYTVSPEPRLKVVYITGPYRSDRGEFYVRCNIREAERAALKVWLWGGVALCPHKNTAGLGGAHGLKDETWLNGDLELLLRCDALYAMPGWDTSAGARAEVDFARAHGIPVLLSDAQLIEFLEPEQENER